MRAIGVASPIKVHEEKGSSTSTKVARAPEPQQGSDIVKTFTMHINPSQSYYEHKKNIRLSPTHGPWPKADSPQTRSEDQDFVFLALKDVVPNTIAHAGLCDWHTGGQLSGEPVSLRAQAADARLWHIKERQERKKTKSRGKGVQDQLGAHLTAVTSLDAFYGSTNGAQRQGQSPDPQNGADVDSTQGAGSPAPPPKGPAWVRRKQFKLNPLADRTHSKIVKREGVMGNWFEWKSLFNSQADAVKLPEPPTEPLNGKT